MIALNEIIKNKDWFEKKFALMGKSFSLDKIVCLESKFIEIDAKSNKLRSECNKLCAQVAELINQNQDTKELIKQINYLDKTIQSLEKKSKRAMSKINRLLSKLPNPATGTNTLNLVIPSKENKEFTHLAFLDKLESVINLSQTNLPIKKYIISQKNTVFKENNLPFGMICSNKNSFEILLFLGNNAEIIQNQIEEIFKDNAKYFIDKSVQCLSKKSNREFLAILSNNSRITIEIWGEYVSREIGLKFYSEQTDMTRFVKMIHIENK